MSTLSTHILDISTGRPAVFTRAQIDFVIGEAADDHFHLPFLIAPGGWSTYRGS